MKWIKNKEHVINETNDKKYAYDFHKGGYLIKTPFGTSKSEWLTKDEFEKIKKLNDTIKELSDAESEELRLRKLHHKGVLQKAIETIRDKNVSESIEIGHLSGWDYGMLSDIESICKLLGVTHYEDIYLGGGFGSIYALAPSGQVINFYIEGDISISSEKYNKEDLSNSNIEIDFDIIPDVSVESNFDNIFDIAESITKYLQ